MSATNLGDLAQSYALRLRNTELRKDITQYNNELTTGMADDLADHLRGSYARLTGIERDLRLIEGFQVTVTEAKQYADMAQVRLGQINDIVADFSGDLLTADFANATASNDTLAEGGRLYLETIVDTMNSQSAGRTLFSGDATDRPALVKAADILTELKSLFTAPGSAVALADTVSDWFDDPAGFEAFAYSGSYTDLSPFRMSDTTRINVNVKAIDPELKEVMKFIAMAAISDDPAIVVDFEAQGDTLRTAAEGLMSANNGLVAVQANVGLAQERIEAWTTQHAVEKLELQNAKGALLAVDPFETASRLESAQFQLETLYAVTARLSNLSLTNYIR
jgi:flagellar hook-associated protein 3 FlgL